MSSDSDVAAFRARFQETAGRPLRANPSLAVALGGVTCLIGFVLVGPLVSRGAADDAGVLSFLLGEARRAPVARTASRQNGFAQPRSDAPFWYPFQAAPATRVAEVRARKVVQRPVKVAHVPRKTAIVALTPPSRPGLLVKSGPPTLLTDDTLRRGDAVMTAKGVRIFNGSRHYPFEVADFRPLAFAGRVPHRNALLAIDRVVRAPAWSSSFIATSPVAAIAPPGATEANAVRLIADRRS